MSEPRTSWRGCTVERARRRYRLIEDDVARGRVVALDLEAGEREEWERREFYALRVDRADAPRVERTIVPAVAEVEVPSEPEPAARRTAGQIVDGLLDGAFGRFFGRR